MCESSQALGANKAIRIESKLRLCLSPLLALSPAPLPEPFGLLLLFEAEKPVCPSRPYTKHPDAQRTFPRFGVNVCLKPSSRS